MYWHVSLRRCNSVSEIGVHEYIFEEAMYATVMYATCVGLHTQSVPVTIVLRFRPPRQQRHRLCVNGGIQEQVQAWTYEMEAAEAEADAIVDDAWGMVGVTGLDSRVPTSTVMLLSAAKASMATASTQATPCVCTIDVGAAMGTQARREVRRFRVVHGALCVVGACRLG